MGMTQYKQRRRWRWEPDGDQFDPTNRRTVKQYSKVAGVYAVFMNGILSYIGQTRDLGSRIASHNFYRRGVYATPWGLCETLWVKVRPSDHFGDELRREARLIRRLKPRFNKNGKGA